MKAFVLCIAVPLLSACMAHSPINGDEPGEPVRVAPEGECDADAVQGRMGTRADADIGAALLAESGARQLRWAPPRSAQTMDYRPDRLTVHYDDSFIITRLQCG